MRLNQIRDLLAIADAGSLRAAARRIGVSQPAMTKSVRQLEEEIKAQLLLRTARGVKPTPAGRAFLARARVIQAELRRAEEDLAELSGGAEGKVALGIGSALTMTLLPQAMGRFLKLRPRARVRIVEGGGGAVLPLVRDETLDFAITQRAPGTQDPALHFRPLLRLELQVAARRGHPLAGARSLRDLADAAWLVFYAPGYGGALERTFAAAGMAPPNTQVHCESYSSALALMATSDLLGLVQRQVLEEPLAARFLQRIQVREEIVQPSVGVHTRAEAPLAPAAALMMREISAVARALARSG